MKTMNSILKASGQRLAVAALAAGLALGWAQTAARAETITDDNIDAAVMAAKTAEEHQALAAYFTAKSEQALANVERHSRMSHAFGSGKAGQSWESHCHALMRTSKEQAKEYAALAKEQAAFAKGVESGKGMKPGM